MSFSSNTKNQLAKQFSHNTCCQLAEFLALTKMDGTISFNRKKGVSLYITTENPAVARKIFKLTKAIFETPGELLVYKKNRLKKNNIYEICIPPQVRMEEIFVALNLMDENREWNTQFRDSFPWEHVKKDCCKRAYLRGAFLGGGSVNDPEGAYHMEIVSSRATQAEAMQKLLADFDIHAKICQRKNVHVLYLKDGPQIVEFLNHIGAHQALLSFENTRIVKEIHNKINRQSNFDMANVNKIAHSALEQKMAIDLIKEKIGLDNLSPRLQEIAELRLENMGMGLNELAQLTDPPVSKSGANHRLKKLMKIAENLK